jgi:Protein of unknown function DUF262
VRTGHIGIGSLIASLDREVSRLPDIQHGDVWKLPQVAHLVDLFHRSYPGGNSLRWETKAVPASRTAVIEHASFQLLTNARSLIDGQQRLISLHSFHDHRKNPPWIGPREKVPAPASEK